MQKIDGTVYDIIVLLQPTVPFRKTKHIDMSIEQFLSDKLESLITVKRTGLPSLVDV